MKENRKPTLGLIIINSLCAAIWTVLAIGAFVDHSDQSKTILYSVCAVIWIINAITCMVRFKRAGKEE